MDNESRVLQQIDFNNIQAQKLDSAKVALSCSTAVASPCKNSTPTCDQDSKVVTPTPQSFGGISHQKVRQLQEVDSLSSSSPYSEIRELDSRSRWCSRNEVITSLEHEENTEIVKSLLGQIIQELPLPSRELSSSSASSEISIPCRVSSPSNSCYLSINNSPDLDRLPHTNSCCTSANSSVYYSVGDTTPEDLSGTESETSLDVTVFLRDQTNSNSPPNTSTDTTVIGLATPVNCSRSRINPEEQDQPLCSSSFIDTTNSVQKHFDKTLPSENTVILKDKPISGSIASEPPVSLDLLGEGEFVRSDLVNFDILPKFDSPRRDTFSIGLQLKNLPADENILKPANFAFESQTGASLTVASNSSDTNKNSVKESTTPVDCKFSEDLLAELEDPLLDKTLGVVDDSFFGAPLEETKTAEVLNITFELSDIVVDESGDLNNHKDFDTESTSRDGSIATIEKSQKVEAVSDTKTEEKELNAMASVYDDDFDFTAIADPFKSSNKMMAESPPLPRRNVEINYDDIDYDAIENPFASSKKMMMDSPPNSEAPIANDLPPPPPALHEDNNLLDESSSFNSSAEGVSMNGSATITRPSAHARTKTKVPPHKTPRRSANTKLSSPSEVTAKLIGGSGDAVSTETSTPVKPVEDYSSATLVKKKATPPPPPKRTSTTPQVVSASRPETSAEDQPDLSSSSSTSLPLRPPPLPERLAGHSADVMSPDFEFPAPPTREELGVDPGEQNNNDIIGHKQETEAEENGSKTGTVYDDDFDFTSIADPFKSSNKMMAESPPLPRRNVEMNYDDIDYDAIENPFASSKKMMMDSPPNSEAPIAHDLPPPPPEISDPDSHATAETPSGNLSAEDVINGVEEAGVDESSKSSSHVEVEDAPDVGASNSNNSSSHQDAGHLSSNQSFQVSNDEMDQLMNNTDNLNMDDDLRRYSLFAKFDPLLQPHKRKVTPPSSAALSPLVMTSLTGKGREAVERSPFSCINGILNKSSASPRLKYTDERPCSPIGVCVATPPPSEVVVTPAPKTVTKSSSKLVANSSTVEKPRAKKALYTESTSDQSISPRDNSTNSNPVTDELEIDSRLHRGGETHNDTREDGDMRVKEGNGEQEQQRLSNSTNHGVTQSYDDHTDGLQPKLAYDQMFDQVSSVMLNEQHSNALKEIEALKQDKAEWESEKRSLIDERKCFIRQLEDLEDALGQASVLKDKQLSQRDHEILRLVKESEEVQSDLLSLEQSFDQAYKRYNKLKDSIEHYKQNEHVYAQELQLARNKIQEEQKMYQTLKAHTEERFREAERQSQEAEKLARGAIMKLEMAQKKLLMANESLQASFEQKVKENTELNELCETLISKLAEQESKN